jgi:hypothetical protein
MRWVLCAATARTGYEKGLAMIRWLIVVFLALVLINGLSPWLQRMGLGRLPGDFRFRLFGREWFIPLASTVLLSFVLSLAVKWL